MLVFLKRENAMKQAIKSITLLMMILVCSQGIANGAVQEKTIWKIFKISETAVLITDDYEIWHLNGLQPNKSTWKDLCIVKY